MEQGRHSGSPQFNLGLYELNFYVMGNVVSFKRLVLLIISNVSYSMQSIHTDS